MARVHLPDGDYAYSVELEWMLAAKWALVPWDRFKALDPVTQAEIVAGYETSSRIEALQLHHRGA